MQAFTQWCVREGLHNFIIVDTLPLWTMVGLACGASVYATFRSSATANDLVWDRTKRGDVLYNDPVAVEKTEKYYMTGVMTQLSKIKNYPQVIPTPFKFEIEQPKTMFSMQAQMVEPST